MYLMCFRFLADKRSLGPWPPILDCVPWRFRCNAHVFLFFTQERRIQRAYHHGHPIRILTFGIRPEQRRAAIATELSGDTFRRVIGSQRLDTRNDRNRRPGCACIRCERCPVALATFSAMAMGNRFQFGGHAIFHCAAQATSLVKCIHVYRFSGVGRVTLAVCRVE
jgi:hypothetical protein